MSKLLRSIIFTAILCGTFIVTSANVLAQTDDTTVPTEETKPILFVLDTCPYCNALLKELEENDLTDKVEIVEVSEEPAKSAFASVITACGIKTAVPTLFLDERCFQGQYSARNRIFEANLIPIPKEETIPTETSTEIVTDEVSNDLNPKEEIIMQEKEETGRDDQNTEEQSLGNKIVNFNDSNNNYSWITFLAALLAPTVLILICFLIIVKMKV